ncbi:hypothetical protein KHA94_17535 [Bacillus sp. FJAT-49705]|uniref:Uncharacterized protein n=1 Tax=Cytobacillus citreus TaxID=2833586 RepID=A0ABS5NVV4_9BACI|nr:hypothetical protein [Cytobacillus citreus]MBS4191970.1 hypothetical protein [Cytobacillus citreus]
MIKSVKGQFILSIIVAIGFVANSFFYIDFTRFLFSQKMFYFVMIFSVFNAGLLTQKYFQTKKK